MGTSSSALALCLILASLRIGDTDENTNLSVSQDDTVVAVVNGAKILRQDIQVSQSQAEAYLNKARRIPGFLGELGRDWKEMKDIMERSNLEMKIRGIIRHKMIEAMDIRVTEEEVAEEVRRQFTEENLQEREEILAEQRAMLRALEMVQDEGATPREAYNAVLAPDVSWDKWVHFHAAVDTPAKRRMFEDEAINVDLQHDKGLRASLRELIRDQKLKARIADEVYESDPEYRKYVDLSKTDGRSEFVRSRGPMFREQRIHQWWEQRYWEADVVILDERFKDAWPPKPSGS